MLSASQIHEDPSHDIEAGSSQHDPLRMPPLLFPPSPPGHGRASDGPIDRARNHHRAFSHSPQPAYFEGLDTEVVSRHNHSNLRFVDPSRSCDDEPTDHLIPRESTSAMEDYLDASLMAVQYLDLPTHSPNIRQEALGDSYSLSESSASSPEATNTASNSSPRAETFSTHSSPGYLLQELPHGMDTVYYRSEFRPHSLAPYGHHRYEGDLRLLRRPSFHDAPIRHRSTSSWGYPPPSLPSISRPMTLGSPSPSHLLDMNAFGQYPDAEDLRHWPQMFKATQVRKRSSTKKQLMACLFCRERKIGCARPPEDAPDQTCNQCARRSRKCEYPTESRRGQHTRNRMTPKKFLGLEGEEPKLAAVIPPRLPVTQ